MKPHRLVRILALSGLVPLTGHAAVHTFTGSDGDWSNASNWNVSGVAPSSGSHLLRINVNGTANFNFGTTLTSTGLSSPAAEDRGLVIGSGSDAANTYTLAVTSGTLVLTNPSGSLIGAGTGNSFAGHANLVLNGGQLQTTGEIGVLTRGVATASGTITINNGSTLTADIVSFATLSATNGTATVNVNTGGTLKARTILDRFAAANSTLNIDGGTLIANDTNSDEKWIRDDAGGVTTNILAGGATFDTNGQDNQRIAVAMGGAGNITKTGAGTLVLSGNNTYAGTTTVSGGTLQIGDNGATGNIGGGALTLGTGTTLAIGRSDNHQQSTFAGAGTAFNAGLSGDVGFSKRGNGIFTMDVANTYTGATTITGGALRIPDLSFLPASSALTVSTSGTIALTGTTLSRNISAGGSGMTVAHPGTEFLAVQRGALQGASGTSTMNGNITLTEALTRIGIQDGATLVLNGNITGSATNAVIFRASGTSSGLIDVNGAASSYGDTHVYGSTVRLGADNAFGTAGVLTVGTIGVGTSTLDLNGNDQTIAGLRADQNNTLGVITNEGAADSQLTIHNTTMDRIYYGVISDGATHKISLVTDGSFRQTLTGNNTFSGPTSVNGGSLAINGSLPNSPVTVGAAGTLLGTGTLGAPLAVAGTVAPGLALATGSLVVADTTITGTYACEINGASTDLLDAGGNLNITGATLAVTPLAGGFTESEYVIAYYSGTLTGTFASVTPGYGVDYSTPGEIKLTSTADPYGSWAELNDVEGDTANADSDGDGIPNGIEFVIGGDPSGPNSSSNTLLPTITTDATYLIFTFRRSDASAGFHPYVQYGSVLSSWTKAVHNSPVGTPVIITEENDAIATGIDRVTVKIPRALASGNRVFARLAVDID